ncbi:MAG TPA: serine/threonine-protein kinase [Gemmatimonadales bacterium]|nr:serine/threonine-protein kinase [Gemmatimonadales bacterium]
MIDSTYFASGTVLQDRYEILGEIGRGGYSVVYRARDRRIGSDVAIKLLVPPPAAARLARERLRREVQAVRQISHPNIVQVFDVAEQGPWGFVVMEYVHGPDLAVRVRDSGPLDGAATARLGQEIADALAVAHRRGILHRDVKPQNILLALDGRARLTDFGSARLAGLATLTQTGGLVGTLDYAAPEVLAGTRADARSEVYSLGVTLFYALTGSLPSRAGRSAVSAVAGHHPRGRRPDVPAWLDAAVARATAADPADRFPSVGLFAAALTPDAGEELSAPPARFSCVMCGAAEPFDLGVCPRCARRADGADDVLVFVDPPTARTPRRAVRDALEGRLPSVSSTGHQALLGGERPLLRVPRAAGERVVELLADHGIPARTESLARLSRTDVPTPILLLAGAVTTGGLAVGVLAAAPLLFATTPLVAVSLVSLATLGRRTPVWNPRPAGRHVLPLDAEREAVRTLAELPSGAARTLLIDLLRRTAGSPVGPALVGALVVAACAVARQLAALDRQLDAGAAQTERLTNLPDGIEALARCEQGRDALVQRLLETTATLSRITGDAALQAALPDSPLAAAARELAEEGRIQADAAREVEELLTSSC